MSDQTPPDPMSALQEASTQIHEMYISYIDAGFTQHEALYLIGQMIQAMVARVK